MMDVDEGDDASNLWLSPRNLPMIVVGLLVIGGTIVSIFAGLPFPTKQEIVAHDRLYDQQIAVLGQTSVDNQSQIRALAAQVALVTTAVAQIQQIQIDRDREQTRIDHRENDAHYQLKRQNFFLKHQDRHYRNEVEALTRSAGE